MCDGYCLVRYRMRDRMGRERSIYALATELGKRDVVAELNAAGDPNDLLGMSVRSITAIQDHGMQYATSRKLVRKISDNVFLVELKSRQTAWRMAAYIRDVARNQLIPVLLGKFKGHGGKSAKIPNNVIKAFEEKALIAKKVVERELEHGNL